MYHACCTILFVTEIMTNRLRESCGELALNSAKLKMVMYDCRTVDVLFLAVSNVNSFRKKSMHLTMFIDITL